MAALLLLLASLGSADPVFADDPVNRVTLSEARLATACVKSGRTKQDCICVSRTLRDKLPAYDYDSSVLLQTAIYSGHGTGAARIALARRGVSAREIRALDRQRRRVVMSANRSDCRVEAGPAAS